ncbi:2,3-bisphosphoglycerate-independent phosphoglycerate mutase [Eubacterium pyruvativorans]|uniref:2,3-bisphosphoglycerate-independent phosphoglycerate mutase n=1 Tax=Eubacterium pyruvativorans TaxID=155865 RepID=UPI0008896F79|nr:2,3-bisphosphoglycerate-independent phosphoglycerate mutase [Eubacterium pyruvativorans]SDF01457.1 phosphoglycerate mutase [Eubacterium pyruvativorans]
MNRKRPSMILIMDGFGINPQVSGNAIAQADTPHLDRIFEQYPMTTIDASGEPVGLPAGQMGNSEVGHMNIGAGRIIYQDLTRITRAAADGSLFRNPVLLDTMEQVKSRHSRLHLMGLLSDGGVHSHIDHLFALIDMAARTGIEDFFVHVILDGRDVPPRCGGKYIRRLEEKLQETGCGRIATVSGRYYAMDRDQRWDRVEKAYDAMTSGLGACARTAEEALEQAYSRDENDEFVLPTVICPEGSEAGTIKDGDAVIMFNFRPDRAREITRALVDPDFSGFRRKKEIRNLKHVSMTEYDAQMPNTGVAFPPETIRNTLGEYLSSLGLKQLRIAETEKYAHVTFFFNGGVEEPNPGEDRILVPSPKVATYDLQPEMSAPEVTEKVLEQIAEDKYDVIILNFANADMVGHTGVMDAAVRAVEALDSCVSRIADAVLNRGGQILLTADHGNADTMADEAGNVITSHSTNPVPLVHISADPKPLKAGGKLADIAPTLLTLMDLPVPEEMTGNVLVE